MTTIEQDKTEIKTALAYDSCLTRFGVSLRFNRGRISKAVIVDSEQFNRSGLKLSRVLNKYDRYLR